MGHDCVSLPRDWGLRRLKTQGGKRSANSPVGNKYFQKECGVSGTQHRLARRPLMQGLSPSTPGWEKCLETFIALSSFNRPHSLLHTQKHSLGCAFLVSMSYPLVILLCVGLLLQTVRAVVMGKLADDKICGDAECSCKSEDEMTVQFVLKSVTC